MKYKSNLFPKKWTTFKESLNAYAEVIQTSQWCFIVFICFGRENVCGIEIWNWCYKIFPINTVPELKFSNTHDYYTHMNLQMLGAVLLQNCNINKTNEKQCCLNMCELNKCRNTQSNKILYWYSLEWYMDAGKNGDNMFEKIDFHVGGATTHF